MKYRFFFGILAALGLAACTSLDDLEGRMDTLESRVVALENQVKALNANVEATAALMQAGTIKEVSGKDGVWTLVLSNGERLTLTQGSVGVGAVPVMSVDAEGHWMVDYGSGKEYVLSDGAKVKATGADGITPVFGVDASGNWTVSYDGGATFTAVLGADGRPVSALPGEGGSDPYFADVQYVDDVFTLVLKDGTRLTVPVVSGFLCSIAGADALQTFTAGETKTFAVTLEGVASTLVTAPDGWTASLGEAILSVTAPVPTRATLADTRTDVSVLAFSASGYATLARVKVTLDDTPAPVQPTAAVTPGEVTANSLSFTVALSDASGWKYLVQESSAVAPSAERLYETGVEGTEDGATVSDLSEATAYTVYVLPYNGTAMGSVAKAEMTTLSAVVNDYYQVWLDGQDIVIAGVAYNRATSGEAVLLTTDEAATPLRPYIHQQSGIFFLECTGEGWFDIPTVTEITGDVVLIGRYADAPATIRPTMCTKLKVGSLVMKNLVFDMVNINGGTNAAYAFNNANATADFTAWHIDGVRFRNVAKPLLYANVAGFGIRSLIVRHSDFQLTHATGNVQLFNFYKSTVLDAYKELVFEDNVVYNANCLAVQVFQYDQTIAQNGTVWECPLSVKDNLFYNCPSSNGYFKFYQLASLRMDGNIFWADPSGTLASYGFILYSTAQDAAAVQVGDNIAYGLAEGRNWQWAHSNSTVVPESNTVVKLDEDPLASFDTVTGAFSLKPAYAGYGPKR